MTVSIIHSTQGICNYILEKEVKKDGNIYYYCRYKGKLTCPKCGSTNVIQKAIIYRTFLGVPFGGTQVYLIMAIPKVQCKDCNAAKRIKTPFAKPYKRYTNKFEEYVISLTEHMTCVDVAALLNISWDTVREIEKTYLEKHYSHPSLKDVRRIAIDEIAVKKGHKYLTIVLDLDTGRVIHVGAGKEGASLDKFWKRLKRSKAKIECVSVDLSPAYTAAVEKHLPNALIVYDHFHLIKLFNDMLSKARRDLFNKLTDKESQKVVKGIRFLLLKRSENLDPDKGEPERIQKAIEMNKDLFNIYYLKDLFNSLWDQPDRQHADGIMNDFLQTAESLNIPALTHFCKTIRRHAIGILNWHDCRISSGPLEGLNNKIKTLKRRAYGYRNMEYFKLKIFAIHKTRRQLVG